MKVKLKASNKVNILSEILKIMLQKISPRFSLKKKEHQKVKERIEVLKEEKTQYQIA